MELSVVIPAYNEEKNIRQTYIQLSKALKPSEDYEIIFVNDGSADSTLINLKKINSNKVRIVSYGKNRGKSYALYRGFMEASGKIIATMDADLQNNPADIPRLSKKIREGHGFALGVRENRADGMSKYIQSWIANTFTNIMFREKFRDRACPLKCFRAGLLKELKYFDGMHRFFPTLLKKHSHCEVKVRHFPRIHGKSRYGSMKRFIKSFRHFLYVKKLQMRGKL